MRDEHLDGKLSKHCLFNWLNSETENEETKNEPLGVKCQECFGDSLLKPLSIYSFNLIQWYIDTPLTCQVLLEPFVNQSSLKYAGNQQTFMTTKLTKLYGIYDSLLNVYNKNYFGLIQDINTQELSLNYQSITSVFDVTSAAGTTQSLKKAESKIKQKATSEFCYYNTYLKKIPLTYQTLAGTEIKNVSLRECAIVLMLDNLVRLKYHADPDPGESRSMQLCTLPVTLKGVPLDAAEIEDWHGYECNGLTICNCMQDKQLSKEDVETMLLKPTESERSSMERFQKLTVWGYTSAWSKIFESGLHLTEPDSSILLLDNSYHDLEDTFSSLQLDESAQESGEESTETFQMRTPLSCTSDIILDIEKIPVEPIHIAEIKEPSEEDIYDLQHIEDLNMENISSVTDPEHDSENTLNSFSLEESFIGQMITDSENENTLEESLEATHNTSFNNFLQSWDLNSLNHLQ